LGFMPVHAQHLEKLNKIYKQVKGFWGLDNGSLFQTG
jgi:hypothetical protein